MKSHALRSLITATAGTVLALGAFSASAKDASSVPMALQNQATAQYGDTFRSNSIKALFSGSTVARGGGICGDSSPDAGEECDDGNTTPGDGCSATCTYEPGFDCSPAIAGSLVENILPDNGFEDSTVGWSATHSVFGANLFCGDSCFGQPLAAAPDGSVVSGTYVLIAGGTFSGPSTGTLTRTPIAVPLDATTLEFQYAMLASGPAGDPCAGAADGITLSLNGTQVWASAGPDTGTCTNINPYERVIIDLSNADGAGLDLRGTSVTIAFSASATGIPPNVDLTNLFIDDVSINVPASPVIPPEPSVCTAVVCGDGAFAQFNAAGGEECDDGNTSGGDGCSAACNIEQPNFICFDPDPAAASGEEVADGGLEDGRNNPSWISVGTEFDPICSQVFCGASIADTGAFYAWFGGSSLPNAQTLTQDVDIAPTATDLTFELLVGICDSANDSLVVNINGNEEYRYDCTGELNIYTTQTVDISAYAGTTATIEFAGNTVATNGSNSNFFVDNISIKDNVAFSGEPGVCVELATAVTTPEEFTAGIPAGWTVINTGADAADGWGASNDGICASQNWSGGNNQNNTTGGGGIAACADSDATGQIDLDGGAPDPLEMDTYLCSPALDLTTATGGAPTGSFLVNYQAANNDFNDNGTPDDTSDDFDDDFLQVLVGTTAPNALTVPNYDVLGDVFDHLDSTLALSEEAALAADLTDYAAETEAYVCFHYRGTYAWFAQIDNFAVREGTPGVVDTDGDGVDDSVDNCTLVANATQLDTNGDGFGNACDADINNDCIVNFVDLGLLKSVFFTPANPDADFDGNGVANFIDLGILKANFFQPPGPNASGTCP